MLKTVGNPSTRYGDQTIVDGNLVIGTAGKGIDFSADPSAAGMTSELLDDYEEGTFTASWEGLTGTPANTTGYYTKIGRVVTFSYETGSSTISGTAGSLGFYVPFTPSKQSTGTQVSGNNSNFGGTIIFTNAKVYCQTFAVTGNNMLFSGTFIV
jgi:hypothetical protein